MQTKFMTNGTTVSVMKLNEDQLADKLPAKIYNVQFNQLTGFYLSIVKDQLEVPQTVYGNTLARVAKCMETYVTRDMSTGILLTGDKGTGKTLLMSVLANKMITDLNLPVLLIKDAYAGNQFVTFIETIGECVIVFDEFGKMYAANDRHNNDNDVPQKALLSLMDGTDKTKRMFIMTENSEFDINDFMLNRPSRIYYHFKYRKLDEMSVTGYCGDYGVSKKITQEIVELSRRSKIFSFDMLQSIVEEHLRFGCDIETATTDLNIDTREQRGDMIEVLKIMERGSNVQREIFDTPFVTKPDQNNYVYIKVKTSKEQKIAAVTAGAPAAIANQIVKAMEGSSIDEDDNSFEEIHVSDSDLAYEQEGKLVYETDEYVFVVRNVPIPKNDYFKMF